ncbi:MAG: TolC family protein [Bryobacteraceae bacterium]|jgi:outer membrane protein
MPAPRKCGLALAVLACAAAARAEVITLTLRQAVELAGKQNPDLALARLDELKTRLGIRTARGPFLPKLTVGSGLAYSNGYPMSIEGAAPSVVQAQAQQFLFNRAQSLQIAQAREDARGAALSTEARHDEIAYRTAALYLDAERAARLAALVRNQQQSQQRVLAASEAQVREGRALPLEQKQAALAAARLRQTVEELESDQADAEGALAVALGYSPEDRVRAAGEDRQAPELPESEDAAVRAALETSKEVRQIESQIVSKGLEMRAAHAARLPRVDLVAQYGMLAKFNNYAEFFNHFQRNNGEIGVSFQLPLFSPSVGAQMAQSETELAHLKIELASARNRIAGDLEKAFREVRKTRTATEVARLDLDVAHEQLSIDLAQVEEGRLGLRQVESARMAEDDKWIAVYDAQYALEKARWNLARLAGTLDRQITALPAGGKTN